MTLLKATAFLLSLAAAGASAPGSSNVRPKTSVPDIVCLITVSENEDGTKPVIDTIPVVQGGGPVGVWVRFMAKNQGTSSARAIWIKRRIFNNSVKIDDPPAERLSLKAGEDAVWTKDIILAGLTNKVSAVMVADVGNYVNETEETNNTCRFRFAANTIK